jgi:hypothetical protein
MFDDVIDYVPDRHLFGYSSCVTLGIILHESYLSFTVSTLGFTRRIRKSETKNRTKLQKNRTKLQDNHNVFNEDLTETQLYEGSLMKGHYTIAEVESAETKPNWEAHPLCSPIFPESGNAVEF